jgi:ferredoxin like protein
MVTDELFDLVSYRIHPEAHIRLDPDVCQGCTHRACTSCCPARCYTPVRGGTP